MKSYTNDACTGFWNRKWIFWIACATVLAVCQSPGYGQEPKALQINDYQLIRPGPGLDRPLFRLAVAAVDESGQAIQLPLQSNLQETLTAIQTSPQKQDYTPIYVKPEYEMAAGAQRGQRYILVLFDVSGSMKEPTATGAKTKFDAAREAARKIFNQFESGTDYVAIAPFESRNVASGIRAASFSADLGSATRQLAALPPPSNGNTGLYTAVMSGLDLFSKTSSSAGRFLIVLTDGQNDVRHPTDDPDLLDGRDGLKKVIDEIRRTQIAVYTIGFGGKTIDEPAMHQIAVLPERYIPAQDELKLAHAFEVIRSQMINSIRVLVMPKEQQFLDLNAKDYKFKVRLKLASGMVLETAEETIFSAPATGMASTNLVATDEEYKAYQAASAGSGSTKLPVELSSTLPPWVTLIIFAALIACLWFLLPRLIWPEYAASAGSGMGGQPVRPVAPMRGAAAAQQAAAQAGWRTQTGRTATGRLTGTQKTNVGPPNNTSSGYPPGRR